MTFKMPLLGQYIFHTDGKIESRSVYARTIGQYLMGKSDANNQHYHILVNDEGVSEKVFVSEIIQYGKHISFLTEMTTLRGTSKYIDLINAFNYSKNKFAQ